MTCTGVNTALESEIGMPEPSAATATLFLDFDGVFHTDTVTPAGFVAQTRSETSFP